jgi:transcription elongation factor Elf1
MGTKLPAAQQRLFKNMFVCKNCNQKMRSESLKVISKTIKCRNCGKHNFRTLRMKKTK